jgi:uridine monophosphate synthetase
MLENAKKILSLEIHELGGIKFKESGFTFNLHKDHPGAPLSPNYINMRVIFRNRRMRQKIAGLMAPEILELNPDRLIDLPESVTPLVTTLSDITGIEMISVRSNALKGERKDHGLDEVINGHFEPGQTGLVVDDVVSSLAHTKFRAIPVLRNAGITLLPFICVAVDREEGGREMLARDGFGLRSLLGLHSDITKHCYEAGRISEKIVQMSTIFAATAKEFALAT